MNKNDKLTSGGILNDGYAGSVTASVIGSTLNNNSANGSANIGYRPF